MRNKFRDRWGFGGMRLNGDPIQKVQTGTLAKQQISTLWCMPFFYVYSYSCYNWGKACFTFLPLPSYERKLRPKLADEKLVACLITRVKWKIFIFSQKKILMFITLYYSSSSQCHHPITRTTYTWLPWSLVSSGATRGGERGKFSPLCLILGTHFRSELSSTATFHC